MKGITDVSSQLEGGPYTNLQLFPMAITPFLIVWDILSTDYVERIFNGIDSQLHVSRSDHLASGLLDILMIEPNHEMLLSNDVIRYAFHPS